jgi:large subunit ribosomal protein L4
MATLSVYNRKGEEVGKFDLDPAEIAPKISQQLLHDAVIMYQANQRVGSHKTKNRGEVQGTSKKMYRQKGTGNARAGSRRSPIRVGGGHTFAKRNRDYGWRMPRRALQVATRMAIAHKLLSNDVVLLDELNLAAPKTKEVAGVLKALKLQGLTTLLATAGLDPVAYKSARNIEGVTISPVADLNALAVLSPKKLLLTKAALELIRERAKAAASEAAS